MTNLATKKETERNVIYRNAGKLHYKQNVIYGCFDDCNSEKRKENMIQIRNAQIKEGVAFGFKIFLCILLGAVLAQRIFDWQNVKTVVLPTFSVVLMWAACAGSVFCMGGLLRNLIYTALRK